MPKSRGLSKDEIEESLRFADGALTAAGHKVDRRVVRDDARRALRGEMTFDEAVKRAVARSRR